MTSRAQTPAQRRFHRQVGFLYAFAIPVLVAIQLVWLPGPGPSVRWLGYLTLLIWALHVIRSQGASSVPLLLANMGYLGALKLVDAAHGGATTPPFDHTTAFGALLLLSVLSGTLVERGRTLWTASLATGVAGWVVAMGAFLGEDGTATVVRALVAIAGITFTTTIMAGLFAQLVEAAERHDRASRLQDAIASCSEALLVHSDVFAVYEATRALLDATDADYAYVDKTIDIEGEPGWEIIADAYRRGMKHGRGWRRDKYSAMPTTYHALIEGRAVAVRTAELVGLERERYEEDGILSEVLVPIFVGREMRGSIGFIQYHQDRQWTHDEIQTLWRAAHMIGAYWRRQEDAEQLRASNDSKDKLLASVSHELRTPLTAIVGLSEEIVANRGNLRDEELDDLNTIIALQSRDLAELVEDLLVASRADFGNLSIRPEPVDLMGQAARVVEGVRESHQTSKSIVVTGKGVEAWADPLRVRQVVRNLLTNAIKYGGDQIELRVDARDGSALLVVADDGAGVSAEETDLIFERYYRSSQSPTQPGSVGIGLAVSRQLAEMMGGSLRYVAEPGGGFELTLPGYDSSAAYRLVDTATGKA